MLYDVNQIAQMLAANPLKICQHLFPKGRIIGNDFAVGDFQGNPGQSLKVTLSGNNAGLYYEFASSEGGNLIQLIQKAKGYTFGEAVLFAKDWLGIRDEKFEKYITPAAKKQYEPARLPNDFTTPCQSVVQYFNQRKISETTLNNYKVGQSIRNNNISIVFPYFEQDGKTAAFIKYRCLAKKEFYTSKNSKPCLFGWQAIDPNATDIVITEGEIDALSFAEQGINALSVPFGGGKNGKHNWIDNEYDRLQYYSIIYLALDMDETGQIAAKDIAERLGLYKCYIIDFGKYKDANEVLQAGGNLREFLYTAKTIEPASLKIASSSVDEAVRSQNTDEEVPGDTLPWLWPNKSSDNFKLREGEVIIWAGTNGHGKSTLVEHIIVDSLSRFKLWLVASMEYNTTNLLKHMTRQAIGGKPSNKDIPLLERLFENLWLYDKQGTIVADDMLKVFEYAYRRYNVRNFLIDSLAKCGFKEDDYNSQKEFVDKIGDFAHTFNVQMNLICHCKKKDTELEEPDKFDIRGSASISDMVENVCIIWRNKKKERILSEGYHEGNKKGKEKFEAAKEEPDVILNVAKQKNHSWEGRYGLFFHRESEQFLTNPKKEPKNYALKYTEIMDEVPF